MISKKITNSSITLKLLISTITIFVVMMLLSNYLIGRKQTQLSDELELYVKSNVEQAESDSELTVIINQAQIRSMREYRLYSCYVIGGAILIGGFVFVLVITRILRPLNDLTEKIERIDVDNVSEARKEIALRDGSRELVQLSQSFQDALDKIYEDYEKQKRFSSNVAHELRTPLAVLLTKVEIFRKEAAGEPPEVQDFLCGMEANITRLSKLVEDVLFLSRDNTPQEKVVNLRELAEEVLFDLEEKAKAKQISLSLVGQIAEIRSDDILLERAIYNLVDNAIKYSNPGGQCEIRLLEENQQALIRVADTGPGIQPEQKELVFDLFYRVEKSRNRDTGGSGIGLAIVQDVVQRLGGKVSVFDNQPTGRVFQIALPQKLPKPFIESINQNKI